MIQEALILIAILVTGVSFLRLSGLRGFVVIPLGFLIGCVLFTTTISLQVLLDVPVSYWLPTITLPLVMTGILLARKSLHRVQINAHQVMLYIGIAALCLATFVAAWHLNIIVFATDTVRQSLASALIAGGNAEFMSSNLVIKRLNAISILDALGFLYNSPYIRTLPIFITLATAGSIAWSLYHLLMGQFKNRRHVITACLIGVAIFMSIYSVWWQSFYQGTHILYGGLLLLVVSCGWILVKNKKIVPQSSLVAIIAVSIVGLMLSRPESGILVPVALLPLLLHPRISVPIKQIIVVALSGSILLQQIIILVLTIYTKSPIPKNAILLAIVGLLILSMAYLIRLKIITKHWLLLLWAIEVTGWFVLFIFTIADPAIFWASAVGTIKNVIFGQGLWGISYMVLVMLFGATLIFEKQNKLNILLRYPITTLLPFGFIVAYLREGAYRGGVYDTFNRMLMHILPLLIVYIVYRYYSSIKKP